MSKIEIATVNTPLNSHEFQAQINRNFEKVSEALDNQLQRTAQEDVVNYMEQELDMGGNRIINLAKAVDPSDAMRKKEFDEQIANIEQWAQEAKDSAASAAEDADDAEEARRVAVSAAQSAQEHERQTQDLFDILMADDSIPVVAENIADVITVAENIDDVKKVSDNIEETLEAQEIVEDLATRISFGNLGDIKATASLRAPYGCEFLDGHQITREKYPRAFQLLEEGVLPAKSVAEYEQELLTKGNTPFFGFDEGADTALLPVVKDIFLEAGDVHAALIEAGLPNITGEAGNYGNGTGANYYSSGAMYVREYTGVVGESEDTQGVSSIYGIDASRSNPVYGNSDTVQPEAVQYRHYIVLTEGASLVFTNRPSVATFTSLPSSGNKLGDIRMVLDSGLAYVWVQVDTNRYTWSSIGAVGSNGSVSLAEWGAISGTLSAQTDLQEALSKKLENTATGANSFAIGGNNIASGSSSIALGKNAQVRANNAIQIGAGTNSVAGTVQIRTGVGVVRLLENTGKLSSEVLPDDIGGTTTLEDIAVAGTGISFMKPIVANHIASADINGSPTISTEGILSNLSSSNYLKLDGESISGWSGSLFTSSYSWSWTVKFKTSSDTTQEQSIFRIGSATTNFNVWCALTTSAVLNCGIHLADGSWSNESGNPGTTVLEANKWYWVRVSRDISTNIYKLELSENGEDWNTEISFTSSRGLYNSNATLFVSSLFGSSVGTAEYDLKGFKFTSNYGSGIDWTAYEYDADKTEISTTALMNSASSNSALIIKSKDGNERIVANSAVLRATSASVALGTSSSYGSYDVVIGQNVSSSANSTNHHNVVIGNGSKATDFYSVAIGYQAQAKGGVAIGLDAKTVSSDSIAIEGICNSNHSIALLGTAGYQAIALGSGANASGNKSIAIGSSWSESQPSGQPYSKATAENSIQIGPGTNSTANTMSVGLSSSLNVQLLDANGNIPAERLVNAPAPDLTGYLQNKLSGSGSIGVGTYSRVNTGADSNSLFFGNNIRVSSNESISIGNTSQGGRYGIAIGTSADCSGANWGVCIGYDSSASLYSTAVGAYSNATATGAIQLGAGTNNEAGTFKVALNAISSNTPPNYTLLDANGNIPGERMSLQGTTAPDTTTVGSIGQFYVDTATGTGYLCVGVDTATPAYTWKQITV